MEEDSCEDDTVDGHMNSSNVDSSEEDMEVSDAASVGVTYDVCNTLRSYTLVCPISAAIF